MKKLTKILILLLSVALVCTSLALVISADTAAVQYTAENGETVSASSLSEALANVAEGGTVTLQSDVEISETAVISKALTLNLNEYTITNTSAGEAILVSAEGMVNINGGGKIVSNGAGIKVSDANPEAGSTPEVIVDGKNAGRGFGLEIETQGEFFIVEEYASLSVSAVEAISTKATASAIVLKDGVYFGSKSSTFEIKDAATAPEGKYFINIENNSIVDFYDTNVITTANGFNVADETLFVITLKGGNFICKGGSAAQTFFTAKGITRGVEAEITITQSSAVSGMGAWVEATGKLFDTDFAGDAGKNVSVNITEAKLILSGDAETATVVFDGNIPVSLGTDTYVLVGEGELLSQSAKDAKSVTALPGAFFREAYEGLVTPEGLSITFDPMGSMKYPYTVGSGNTADTKFVDFNNGFSSVGINTPTVSPSAADPYTINHFTGWIQCGVEDGNGAFEYHLPEYVSDGNGGYKLADGAMGTVCNEANYLNIPTYTPGDDGAPGKIDVTKGGTAYIDLYFLSRTVAASSGSVIKYSCDVKVDEEGGAPDFSFSAMGNADSSGKAHLGAVLFKVNGFTITSGSNSMTIEGGKYVHIDTIVDLKTFRYATYVNGVKLNEGNRGTCYSLRNAMRLYLQSGTFHEDATLYIDNMESMILPGYTGGAATFIPDDYNNYTVTEKSTLGGSFTVNGFGFDTIEQAYSAAAKLDSVVEVNAPLAAGEYLLPEFAGVIKTNGFCPNVKFISSVSSKVLTDGAGNDVYHFSNDIYGTPVTVDWYYGISANPAEDKENWTSSVVGGGSAPAVPAMMAELNTIADGRYYKIIGWTDEYISFFDFESMEEYNAAAAAAVLPQFELVTKEEGETGVHRVYYPAYELSSVLFKVERVDGTVNVFTSISDWNRLASTYKTADREALADGLRDGDVLTLLSDMTWNSGSAMQIGQMSLTIDLNGYTMDTSARSGMNAFILGSSDAGNGSGNHNNPVGLNLITSREGGKIIDRKPLVLNSSNFAVIMTVFNVCGSNKTLHVGGAGSYTVGFECATLIQIIGIASGTGSGCSLWFDDIDVKQIEPAAKNGIVYPYTLIDYKTTGGNNRIHMAALSVKNANIVSDTRNYIIRTWDGSATAYRQDITFENTNIEIKHHESYLARLDSAEHNLVLKNTKVSSVNASFGIISKGKIIVCEGSVIPQQTTDLLAYNATTIKNGTGSYKGVYYGAAGLTTGLHSVYGETVHVQAAKPSDLVTATWKDLAGEVVESKYVTKGADFQNLVAPVENLTLNTMIVSFTWGTAEDFDETAPVYVPVAKEIERTVYSEVSVNLNTQLSVNVYVPVSVFQYVAEGSTLFDTGVTYTGLNGEECYRATIPVDTDKVFTGVNVTLNLNEAGYVSSKTTTISVVEYAKSVLENEALEAKDHDLAYYMLTYISAAYDYMDIDDNANAVAEIAAILGDYQPVGTLADRTEYETDASALAGKLEVAVKLSSTPVYVFKVLDETVTAITVNGTECAVVNGLAEYRIERIADFDGVITITVGESAGTYCYADYEAAVGNKYLRLEALIDALYEYILFTKSY